MPETTEMRQAVLPLSRDERLELVKRFRMRRFATLSNVTRDNIANLVEQIELSTTSDGCRLIQEVLAGKLNVDVRTLRRWLRIADELHLILIDVSGGREHKYNVKWDCVRRLGQTHSVTELETAIMESEGDAPQSDREAASGEAHFAHATASNSRGDYAGEECRPPVNFVRSDRTNVRSDRTFVRTPHYPINPLVLNKDPIASPINPIDTRSSYTKTVLSGESGHSSPEFFELTIEVLTTPELIDRWFQFAIDNHGLREVDRLRVFTAAHSVIRRSRRRVDPIHNPPGAFWRIIKRRLWKAASAADEEWARRAIRELDNGDF